LFKTTLDKADAIIARITELHRYSVPAIAVWPIERLPESYAEWVESSLR
jgi:periplasmic divalent cation tolerance protein